MTKSEAGREAGTTSHGPDTDDYARLLELSDHLRKPAGWPTISWWGTTFVGDVQVPFSDDVRAALVSLFEMCWAGNRAGLTSEDLAEYQRLCLPDSPDFIVDHPDYHAYFIYSLFFGKVAD